MKLQSRILDAGERAVRAACAELDTGLRAGTLAGAEAVFEKYPTLAGDAEAAVEIVFTEYLTRELIGRSNEPAGYYERFPQWRDRLERLFQVDDLLKDDTAPSLHTAFDSKTAVPSGDRPTVKRVAGYELLEKLGTGGMGVVFKAVQPGLKRVVALKLLRHGSEASTVILERFRREAELTARLQHPNIVSVFDVGEANGEPYLAMEYVAGGTLRERLQNKILAADEAARLVYSLAKAVEYAHQHNVVHRDLKPGNILLEGDSNGSGTEAPTLLDSNASRPDQRGEWNPRITDFGLAVCREQSSALTRQGQILGTPSYMAPEQASGRLDDAGPGVDIYALGAILYECLTGRPPFLADTELETLRQVEEQDPVPPRELQPNTPRDLETVCLKCLHKDPAKRYLTAGALADDLGRFRTGDAILARPASVAETTVKWVRRHPTATISGLVGVLAITAGLVLTAQYANHLKIARDGADLDASRATSAAKVAMEEREKAIALAEKLKDSLATEERQRRQARAVLDNVLEAVIEEWLIKLPQLSDPQKLFLNRVLAEYESLAAGSPDDEAGRIGLARATRRVGYMRSIVGALPEAESSYRRAKELYEPFRNRPEYRGEYAILLEETGGIYEKQNRLVEAVTIRTEALRMYDSAPNLKLSHIHVLNTLGRTLQLLNRHRDALPLLVQAQTLVETVDFSKTPEALLESASVLDALGQTYQAMGKPAEARSAYRTALERLEPILAEHPEEYHATYLAARIGVNLSTLVNTPQNGPAEALALATKAESQLASLVAAFPGLVKYRHDLGIARNAIGNCEVLANRYDRAGPAFRGAIEAYKRVLKDSPGLTAVRESLGGSYCNLGIVHRTNGDVPASIDALTKALETLRPLITGPGAGTVRRFAVNAGWNKARSLCLRAKDESAETRSKTIAECLTLFRECQQIIPDSLKGFLRTMTTHPDFAPLRDDEAGAAFLAGLKGN